MTDHDLIEAVRHLTSAVEELLEVVDAIQLDDGLVSGSVEVGCVQDDLDHAKQALGRAEARARSGGGGDE